VVENVKSGRVVSGASTITQQLIKITRGPQPRSWRAKLMEALQARHLEQVWTKDQILGAYLTRVSYGNLFMGCRVASQGDFRKPLKDLTAAEAAFLAGLPQAPGRLNPFRTMAPAIKRQQWVLSRMQQAGWLTGEDRDLAVAERLRLAGFHGGFIAPHAVGLIESGLGSDAADGVVKTTIDSGLQQQVERGYRQAVGSAARQARQSCGGGGHRERHRRGAGAGRLARLLRCGRRSDQWRVDAALTGLGLEALHLCKGL